MTDQNTGTTSEDTTTTTPKPEAGAAPEDQEQSQQVNGEADDDEPALHPDDPDAVELREAETALKAEAEGKKETDDGGEPAAEEGKPEAAEADAGTKKPEEAAPATEKPEADATQETAGATSESGEAETERQGPDEDNKVPQTRVNEIVRQRNEAVLTAARLQGQNEAMRAMMEKGPAGPDGKPLPEGPAATPEERITAIRAQKAESTQKYEEGELSAVEWQKQQDEFEDQVFAVRQEQLQAGSGSQAPGQADQPPARDPYVESLMDGLEAAHPYSTVIESKLDWAIVEAKAYASLADEGVQIIKGDPQSTLALRTRMAEITDDLGPGLTGKTPEEAKAIATAKKSPKSTPVKDGQAAPAQKKPGELSPEAQARKEKLDLAKGIAPDVSNLGGANSGTELPTDEQILGMDEEQIAALPAPALRKFTLPDQ